MTVAPVTKAETVCTVTIAKDEMKAIMLAAIDAHTGGTTVPADAQNFSVVVATDGIVSVTYSETHIFNRP